MDNYYSVPEDVKMSWAHLVDDLVASSRGHGGYELTFSILVRKRIPSELLQPVYRKREPRGSFKNEESKLWWSVVRRLQSCGNGRDCLIEMSIDLDLNDNPVSWREPVVRHIEPKR